MLYVTNAERTTIDVVECRSGEVRTCPLYLRRNPKGHISYYDVRLSSQDLLTKFDVRGRSKVAPHWALVATRLGPAGTAAALRRELGYVPGPLPEPPPPTGRRPRKRADPRQMSFADAIDDGETTR